MKKEVVNYEAPELVTVELNSEGVLCQSFGNETNGGRIQTVTIDEEASFGY